MNKTVTDDISYQVGLEHGRQDSPVVAWQKAYDEQFRRNETLQRDLKTLRETFDGEMQRIKTASENPATSSLDRFCHRLFHEILEELHKKMWSK